MTSNFPKLSDEELRIVFATVGAHYASYGIKLARAVEQAVLQRCCQRHRQESERNGILIAQKED